MKSLKIRIGLLGILVASFAAPSLATAASISYKGISLSPAIEQLNIQPGQTSLSYTVRVDSSLSSPVTLSVSSLDFKSFNDTGGLAFVGNSAGQLQHKYGLANWLDLPNQPVTLDPNGGQFINITIENLFK